MRTILFDIDGTLLFSGGAGRRAMTLAFRDVYGLEDGFAGISMSGKTDAQILREALLRAGLPLEERSAALFRQRYFEHLRSTMNDQAPGKRLVPGVNQLLEALRVRGGVLLGLLTGNWRESAYIKLRRFGIDHFFPFGAFADDSEDRNALLPVAIRRAESLARRQLEAADVWIVGDTPRDVECGSVHGVKVLGVASGEYGPEVLAAAGATAVVRDFRDVQAVLGILLA
ncbi:MAG: haloacid dehalogenase-like hydrolase [candidate division KSB1 bacterium]|nr:haloacid dehalogenase-like hydrolase [candidate division KSB1 bacterium]